MATQHVRELPVHADADTLADLRRAVDEMSTEQATAYAIDHGVTPPSTDNGWEILLGIEPDGTEVLVWTLVTELDD